MKGKSGKRTKRDFIQLVRNTGEEAAKARPQLQSDLQYIHFFEQFARPYAAWAEAAMPDDGYAPPSDIAAWEDAYGKIRSAQPRFLDIGSTAASTATFAYSVIGADVTSLPADRPDQAEKAKRELADVLSATSWDTDLEDEFYRLGLDRAERGTASALDLYRQAHSALTTPSGAKPNAAGVLIPMRSCIDRAIADLKRRCSCQRKTGKRRHKKIIFIWEQMGKAGADSDEMAELALRAEPLNDDLSAAKDKDLGGREIQQLFSRSAALLKAILTKLDEGQMRKA